MGSVEILEERRASIQRGGAAGIKCGSDSVSGAVSQRACVYCGARVVLNPITDACHIVHGPIGCASYTWDIRGSLSSGSDRYRNSFSTDLRERDIVFGGAEKLARAVDEVAEKMRPKLIFIYATCIVGVIGDDVEAVAREAEKRRGVRVIPVKSPGFSGTKQHGYRMACEAIMQLIRPHRSGGRRAGVNILGDFNLAGETWIIKNYLREIGIPVRATITGDASYDTLITAPAAALNIVQCAGSMTHLAKMMEEEMGVPYLKVSFFGVEDAGASLIRVAEAIGDDGNRRRAREFTRRQADDLADFSRRYRPRLEGKKAAIYVGGGFKAISLIRQFKAMGMETVVVGTQTGQPEDYEIIGGLVGPDAVILDDANPAELEKFMLENGADILVGGVKERPLAYKLGIAFCDHNHERRHALVGYDGV
ncbi:MAG: nitrogenase iron-molybdenum cofactor biosynthesis protein NifE, partial [Planctomycetota bacterium]|nr:nitrogenase iron-molybdenum cofactor biosynthesis protein NifE [Planctomycetota bacterium]